MTKRSTMILALGACVAIGAYEVGRARAGGIPSPDPLTYSGTITDQTGAPQGFKTIKLKLFTAETGGTSACAASGSAITDATGHFELPLPDACTSVVNINPNVWVQLNVDGNDLSFRVKIGAVPYAVAALRTTISRNGYQYSDGATFCGGLPATTGAITSGSSTGLNALKLLCATKCGPGAHVCSAEEIVRSSAVQALPTAQTWYATGVRTTDGGNTVTDCDQFTSSDATAYGETIDASGHVASAACSTSLPVACCD